MNRALGRLGWVASVGALAACGQETRAQDRGRAGDSSEAAGWTPSAESAAAGARDAADLLRQSVDEVRWDDVALEDALDWLSQRGRVNVLPDWKALGEVGVSADTLVSIRLRRVRVADVLDALVDALAPDGAVTYQGQANILRLSTRQGFERRMIVRVYDAADLTVRIPRFRGAPSIEMVAQSSSSSGGGSLMSRASGDAGAESESGDSEDPTADPAMNALADLIEDVIEPASWDTYGGSGRIRVLGGRLVVRNTAEVHEQIGGRVRAE
ncbi:MAG: hypothetical protein IT449_08390 [Phycisphaerales bacterium]|nr:hypothetical protein [Phycisphaerales bacterium]